MGEKILSTRQVRWLTLASAISLAAGGGVPAIGETGPQDSARTLEFTAREGSWMQPDVSPDGRTIIFDLLGDIYTLPIEGGRARPLLTGDAFESHPAFSPDGRRIAFVSDRSGVINLWIADADGRNLRQLSRETSLNVMAQPTWSADGKRVLVSRLVHSLLGFELFSFPVEGGAGEQVTRAQPNGNDGWDKRYNALGAIAGSDGALHYAARRGDTFTPSDPDAWSVVRRDPDGKETRIAGGSGGAMAPALSSDRRMLAYATREGANTVLRLRSLDTGEDRRLTALDRDGQEGGYYGGVLPRFRFLPGDRELLLSRNGGFERLSVSDGSVRPIPFEARVRLDYQAAPRRDIPEPEGPVRVRVIQGPSIAPDGKHVAFTALGRLFVGNGNGKPRPIAAAGVDAWQPSWSPDGGRLAFVRWNAREGGAVWTVGTDGRDARRHTRTLAYYAEPTIAPDGYRLAALRASHHDRLTALTEIDPDRPTAIVLIDLRSGEEKVLARTDGARQLQWSADGRTLEFYGPGGLRSLSPETGEIRTVAQIVGQSPSQYVGAPVPVDEAVLSPDRQWLLVRHASQLWRVALPSGDVAAPIDLTAANSGARRITGVGADFAGWTSDGGVFWSVGATLRRLPAALIEAPDPERRSSNLKLEVSFPRARPAGSLLLRGATVLTMRGDEVIPNADLLIEGNRIVAVGASGSFAAPANAQIIEVSGKTIIPGLVDAHAHLAPIRRRIHEPGQWPFALNLAFGVTALLDVQPFTVDIFAYQDMIDAGMMAGPRSYSTGPGMFRNSPHANSAELAAVFSRYRDHYRTNNLKAYMIGDRADRRQLARAARAAGMIATTEGASDLPLGLTHFIDGFAGQEHALPVTPLRDDIVRLMAATRTSYTPAMAVLYGGGSVTDAMVIGNRWQEDPRIRALMPTEALAHMSRGRRWLPAETQSYRRFAADALAVQRGGGLVAMGSHGEVQGLGLHWEMQAYVEGGATPMEAMAAATIRSAEAIGRRSSLGSIEPGKLADLVILDADPRDDIANARRISSVVKDGKVHTMAELLRSEHR